MQAIDQIQIKAKEKYVVQVLKITLHKKGKKKKKKNKKKKKKKKKEAVTKIPYVQ